MLPLNFSSCSCDVLGGMRRCRISCPVGSSAPSDEDGQVTLFDCSFRRGLSYRRTPRARTSADTWPLKGCRTPKKPPPRERCLVLRCHLPLMSVSDDSTYAQSSRLRALRISGQL